jgi:hypothetical protein
MPTAQERERLKKARGAVLGLFDKSLKSRAEKAFAPKQPEPKPEAEGEGTAAPQNELSDEDAEALAAEYGNLGE